MPSRSEPSPARHRATVGLCVAVFAAAAWWAWPGTGPADATPVAAATPADMSTGAALASPFGSAGAGSAAAVAEEPVPAPAQPAAAAAPAMQAPPTLAAEERAQVRDLLRTAPALDEAGQRETEALLFHDAVLRLQALQAAGDHGPEAAELKAELRAGLPARMAARDVPAAVLDAARALLDGRGTASPFAPAR